MHTSSETVSAVQATVQRNKTTDSKLGTWFFSGMKVVAPALCFLAVVLAINPGIFRTPYAEDGDFAANALQIQNAKAFRELLGNYSRWHFHHPGPAWFYLLAGGEYLFHDLLHLVPAPINAQILTIILVNVLFVFGALAIFRSYAETGFFVPLAVAAVVLLIFVINRTATDEMTLHGALFSVWMPDVLLFCFLFFATACASVASGRIRHLPLMTFSGLLLVHGHVAQLLFVGVMAVLALGTLLRRLRRSFGQFLRANRSAVIASVLMVLIFAFPIVLEMRVDKPNNVQHILEYMRMHRGERNNLRLSLKYCLSFLMGVGKAETAVQGPVRRFLGVFLSRRDVIAYWLITVAGLGILLSLWRRRRMAVPFFFRYIFLEIVLISGLFLYWAVRITGPLYSFNGFFFYSVQILLLWLILALLTRALKLPLFPRGNTIAACGVSCLMLLSPPVFRNNDFGNPLVSVIASRLPRGQMLRIDYDPRLWPVATGVASVRTRSGEKFCVEPDWDFMFGERYVCHDMLRVNRIEISGQSLPCAEPCRLLYEDGHIQVDFLPIAPQPLPLDITARDTPFDFKQGFYRTEGQYRWTERHSLVRFLLPDHLRPATAYRLGFTGVVLPGRPVQVELNGRALGSIAQPGNTTMEFVVDENSLRPVENRIVLSVDKAGPVGSDPRTLGYYLHDIQIEAKGSESLAVRNSRKR
jgi:hypothetical protein